MSIPSSITFGLVGLLATSSLTLRACNEPRPALDYVGHPYAVDVGDWALLVEFVDYYEGDERYILNPGSKVQVESIREKEGVRMALVNFTIPGRPKDQLHWVTTPVTNLKPYVND